MALINEKFPELSTFGTSGGTDWNTTIVEQDSGLEQRFIRWPVGRHQYDIAGAIRTNSEFEAVRDFHWIAQGRGNYFRFKDWLDYKTADSVTATDSLLLDANGLPAQGDGVSTEFYLSKTYSVGASSLYRPIVLPIEATVLVAIDGVPQATPGDYTLDATTGKITFTTPPLAATVLTNGCEFDVPCRFNADFLPANIVNKSGDEFLVDFEIGLIEVWV